MAPGAVLLGGKVKSSQSSSARSARSWERRLRRQLVCGDSTCSEDCLMPLALGLTTVVLETAVLETVVLETVVLASVATLLFATERHPPK